jgi:hypothetical protein
MPTPTFKHAHSSQPDSGFWLHGPEVFRAYCRRHGLRADTATTISVDHIRTLSKELREANTMVLRLGTGHGDDDARGQTAFALIRHEDRSLAPFFLIDDHIFTSRPETLGDCRNETYRMAPDSRSPPRSADPRIVVLCGGWRDKGGGLEDKPGGMCHDRNRLDPRPLHALAVPVRPAAQALRAVCLRMTDTNQGLECNVAECAIDDGREGVPSLHSVEPVRHRRLRLRSPGG